MDMVQGMAHVQRDITKVLIKQGQENGMEEHLGDHCNVENINISLASTNSNRRAPRSLSHTSTHTKDTDMEGNWTELEESLWSLVAFMMELLRCPDAHLDAHSSLLMDFIQVAKVELASMGLMSYKLQCTSCLMESFDCIERILFKKRLEIATSNGQCNLVLKDLYRHVVEAKRIVEECFKYKSWLLKAILFLDNGRAFHQIIVYVIDFTKILLRALSRLNHNDKRPMEIEGEITMDHKHFNNGVTTFEKLLFEEMSCLEQNACVCRIELIKQLVGYVQEQELYEDDPICVPFLVAKFLGPCVYYDMHVDKIFHLGTGKCGHVYKTMWIGLECAQKVFKDIDNKSAFTKKVSSWVGLCHQNIVHIYCGIIVGGECSLLMELMFTNLPKFMESRNSSKQNVHPFPLHVAFDIILQIAKGMLYLHGKNIVHHDLRSQNILVTPVSTPHLAEEGYVHVKLADFGLGELSIPRHLPCTKTRATNSMAPELEENVKVESIFGKSPNPLGKSFGQMKNLDHPMKTDVYNFGKMCFEILSSKQGLQKNIHDKGKRSSSSNYNLFALIDKCCANNPFDRPSFASIVKELEDHKPLTPLPRSLCSGSSHSQINKRSQTAKKASSPKISQNSSDNLTVRTSKSPNFGCKRSKSFKRSRDYLMEEDEYHELVGKEQINFVDNKRVPHPTSRLTKFPRNNYSSIEMCEFARPLHDNKYQHLINPTNFQGSEESNLSMKLSSSQSQSQEKHIGCTQLEVNVKCSIERENGNVVWLSSHKVDISMVENPYIQDLKSLHSTQDLVDHHNEEEIARSGTNFMNLEEKLDVFLWNLLPRDIHEASFNKLDYEDLCKMKQTSKDVKALIDSDAYHASRGEACPSEASMSSLYFFINLKERSWHCSGFDCILRKWRRLPPLTCLPPPDEDLFKEYLVAGSDGLFCINVSKVAHEERLLVCNPLTQKKIELPPLNLRRNPVLMHMLVNHATNSYKVIVAGSSGMEGGDLSKCTEVFDSLTWEWEKTGDIPGPKFCLNEYQTGVCINNILYCIAFLDDGSGEATSGKGVLAYDINEGKWVANWRCPLPSPTSHHTNSIAQLLECDGELYLFLEREHGRHVDHCIEKLESQFSSANMVGIWKNVVKESKAGGRGLLVYPEFTCVPHGNGKVCIFNTIEHKGVVYDIVSGGKMEEIQPPPTHLGEGFHSLNPLSFTFHPNFKNKVDGNVDKCGKSSMIEASIEKVGVYDKPSNTWGQNVGDDMDALDVQISFLGRPSIDDPRNKVDANQEGRNNANSSQLSNKHKNEEDKTQCCTR